MARIGTDPRKSQGEIMRLRLPSMFSLRQELKKIKKSQKGFPTEFRKTSTILANAYRRWAATYAPKEFGVLDKPRLTRFGIGDIATKSVGWRYEITFWTDYAHPLEVKNWGPAFGHPYRPKTKKKFQRLGTPIGPHYADRAQKDFEKWLQKNPPKFSIPLDDIFEVTVSPSPMTGPKTDDAPPPRV